MEWCRGGGGDAGSDGGVRVHAGGDGAGDAAGGREAGEGLNGDGEGGVEDREAERCADFGSGVGHEGGAGAETGVEGSGHCCQAGSGIRWGDGGGGVDYW